MIIRWVKMGVISSLLTACATASGPLDAVIDTSLQPILVRVTVVDQKTYDMAPAVTRFQFADPLVTKAAYGDAVAARATQLCGAGGDQVVATDVTAFLFIEANPRSRVRCN